MPSTFLDYEKLVLADYERKRSLNQLHSDLILPTRGKLKRESVRLCTGQIHPKDEKAIKDFCDKWDEKKSILQNVENYDEDKFRPLSTFLQGKINSTDQKNIQLLAWLIDFPHRPYYYDKDYSSLIPEEPILSDPVKTDPIEVEITTPTIQPVRSDKWRPKKSHISAILLTFIGLGVYLWVNNTDTGGCMYWAGDHYQQIPCNQPMPHTLVIALDTAKVNNFKKITRPDTITHRSKGNIWYSKIDNQVEFFTSAGEHPEALDRHLKPISDHIIDTYIRPKASN